MQFTRSGNFKRLGTEDSTKDEDSEVHYNEQKRQEVLIQTWLRAHGRKYGLIGFGTFVVGYLIVLFVYLNLTSDAGSNPQLSLEEWRNGTYAQHLQPVSWVPDGKHGEVLLRTPEGHAIKQWGNSDSREVICPLRFNADGESHEVLDIQLNPARTHALVRTDAVKHWRYSSFSRFWLLDIDKKQFTPVHTDALSLAQWSSDGVHVAYVHEQNVFVLNTNSSSVQQVTNDGGENVFNGIPDWVYEEEVFTGDTALWWSAGGNKLAYLRTNDSLVPKFPIPYFIDDKKSKLEAYPDLLELKYPKPGFANPEVSLYVYDTSNKRAHPVQIDTELNDPIIGEVLWVGEQLVVKVMDREADFLEVWVAQGSGPAVKTRSYSSEELGGSWFEVTHNSHAVGSEGYVDTIDVGGYNHLAYFSPVNSSDPIVLTRGEWEVQDSAIAVNTNTRHVYFLSTQRSSMQNSLYRVSLDDPQAETPEEVAYYGPGVYSVSFSGDASFAMTIHAAPTAPLNQRVVRLSDGIDWELHQNVVLKALLENRKLDSNDSVVYGTVDIGDGVLVNYREIRPSNFNKRRKHPLLFFNYGGPGSQQVQEKLVLDYQRVYAEQHNAIVVTVDPRGSGNRGRAFRATVRDHLGEFEADDVIAVAKLWNQKKYIDSRTTAIWGWSYGGYLTLKTLERDVDLEFKYGIAVAPVTDFRLYDSIYTERYMHTPEHNPEGYGACAVMNVTNISRHNRFLVMHGTGDDNVHFQHTLTLLDKLDLAGIENYDVHVFPDSDHSISFHNANAMVYDRLDEWLHEQQS